MDHPDAGLVRRARRAARGPYRGLGAPAGQGRGPRGQDRGDRHPAQALGQLHGIALNVDCDLSHFCGIVPCGVAEPRYGVTSLADLGLTVTMAEVDMAMRARFRGFCLGHEVHERRVVRVCRAVLQGEIGDADRDTNSPGDRPHASPWNSADDGKISQTKESRRPSWLVSRRQRRRNSCHPPTCVSSTKL